MLRDMEDAMRDRLTPMSQMPEQIDPPEGLECKRCDDYTRDPVDGRCDNQESHDCADQGIESWVHMWMRRIRGCGPAALSRTTAEMESSAATETLPLIEAEVRYEVVRREDVASLVRELEHEGEMVPRDHMLRALRAILAGS